jgi:ATP-dependent DNA ligase
MAIARSFGMDDASRTTPVAPPLRPMLARLTHEIPVGDYVYEPKWDGFRALAFRRGATVDIRSRHDSPMSRYFPELVAAMRALEADRFVLDGEIVLAGGEGDFSALMLRLHPAASRVERLSGEAPAQFVAFDLIAEADHDLRDAPFVERRRRLERLLTGSPPALVASMLTDDPRVASRWLRDAGRGIDGVVAKERSLPYLPGKRAMVKVKTERSIEAVVAGFRVLAGTPRVGSLLLGLYDADGLLRHVGVTSNFTESDRRTLLDELHPLITKLGGHPWEAGFGLGKGPTGRLAGSAGRWDPAEMSMDWVPIRPERVAEVAYDAVDGMRFRHPAKFRRWRPDRTPESCLLDQLAAERADARADSTTVASRG